MNEKEKEKEKYIINTLKSMLSDMERGLKE